MPRTSAIRQAPGDWVNDAACATPGAPDMDIGRDASPARIEQSRQVCHRCPVIDPCRRWALTVPDPAADHVAGGLTHGERVVVRRIGESGT